MHNTDATFRTFGKVARKFMNAASKLVDAANARGKYDSDSRGLAKANERYIKAEAEYDAAYAALDEVIKDLG